MASQVIFNLFIVQEAFVKAPRASASEELQISDLALSDRDKSFVFSLLFDIGCR
jgi:hypothetical protein